MKIIRAIFYIILTFTPGLSAQSTFQSEDSSAVEFFRRTYSVQKFEKYDGKIASINDLIKYDSTVLRVRTNNMEVREIFTLGIFYPAVFFDHRIYGNSSFTREIPKEHKEKLSSSIPVLKNPIEVKIPIKDTITLSNIEELTFLGQSPKVKRFRMWVNRGRLINPIVYFFQLINDEATESTGLYDFIKGSKLTFVQEAWIII